MPGEIHQNLANKFEAWLMEQGDDPACQTHDNEPEKIVETFPVKGDRKTTEQYLTDRVWWWRKANDQDYREIFRQQGNQFWSDILYPIYRDRFSLCAYRYELLARCQSTPGYPFGCPWIRCTNEQRKMLGCLWPNPWPARYCYEAVFDPSFLLEAKSFVTAVLQPDGKHFFSNPADQAFAGDRIIQRS